MASSSQESITFPPQLRDAHDKLLQMRIETYEGHIQKFEDMWASQDFTGLNDSIIDLTKVNERERKNEIASTTDYLTPTAESMLALNSRIFIMRKSYRENLNGPSEHPFRHRWNLVEEAVTVLSEAYAITKECVNDRIRSPDNPIYLHR